MTVGELGKSTPMLEPVGIPAQFTVQPALPEGLEIGAEDGIISGKPTQNGVSKGVYTVTATNTGGTVTGEANIVVNEVTPTGIVYDVENVIAIASSGMKEGGNPPQIEPAGTPVAFSVEPELPEGLQLDQSTGAISGVPTAASVGETEHTITATNTGGACSTQLKSRCSKYHPRT
jgi:hypothetical protein